MPMYGGMLCEATLHGLLEIQQWSMAISWFCAFNLWVMKVL